MVNSSSLLRAIKDLIIRPLTLLSMGLVEVLSKKKKKMFFHQLVKFSQDPRDGGCAYGSFKVTPKRRRPLVVTHKYKKLICCNP